MCYNNPFLLQTYLEGMGVGVMGNIISSFMGNVHNRMVAAFEKGDMETARLEQVWCGIYCTLFQKQGKDSVYFIFYCPW